MADSSNTWLFEFDPEKSQTNLRKHGIDFSEGQALWDDQRLREVPVVTEGEPRFLIIGVHRNRHWTAVITYRSERVRIISVRRSRREEVRIYEDQGL